MISLRIVKVFNVYLVRQNFRGAWLEPMLPELKGSFHTLDCAIMTCHDCYEADCLDPNIYEITE